MEDFHRYFLKLRLFDREITHPAICYTTFDAQAALSQEQGILLLAENPLCDAPSYAVEMCLARAERCILPGQPVLREGVLTGQVQLLWCCTDLLQVFFSFCWL